MDDLTAKLKQYEFFKDMDCELEPLLLKSYNHGKIFVVKIWRAEINISFA